MHDDKDPQSQSAQRNLPPELNEKQYVLPDVRDVGESKSSSGPGTATDTQQSEEGTASPPVAEICVALFRNSAVPYLVGSLFAWFFGAFVVYPEVTGIEIASSRWANIFVLQSTNPEYYWAWLTSIFTHGSVTHLVVNSVVLFFAGLSLERYFGSRELLAVFFSSSLVASAAQIGVVSALGETMRLVGASGGIAGVFGALLTVEPNEKVRMFFIIPMKLWSAMLLLVIGSVGVVVYWGVGAGGLAHIAHVAGLLVGITYGVLRDKTAVSRVFEAVKDSDVL